MIELEIHWPVLTALAVALASVHLWFPWFDRAFARHERIWMGFAGGVATGYVTLYMLPKLSRITATIIGLDESATYRLGDLRMYYIMLLAISVYLVMSHLEARQDRWRGLARLFDYLVHAAYSFLIGYVMVELSSGYLDVNLMIALILALHLMGMNHVLRSARTAGFDRAARWYFFCLVLIGAGFGLITELPKLTINALTAFLAGIILVNVISEELPLRHRDRVPWYLTGVVFYLALSSLILTFDPRPAY